MGHKPPIPDKVSPEGKDFLCHCLESDPKMRWTASQLLDHPFVKVCPMALATKTVDGNQKRHLVGCIVCSCATGLCATVGGCPVIELMLSRKQGLATFQKHIMLLTNVRLKEPGAHHAMNFHCCFGMHYLYVKKTC